MISKKQRLPIALFLLWITLTAAGFWFFQFQHITRFNAHVAEFNGQAISGIKLQNVKALPTVVHLVQTQCPCSRFANPHIEELEQRFGAEAEFVHWDADDERIQALVASGIPATPAVAIWSGDGELAYFGPYSSGYLCGEGDDFVAATLIKLGEGINPAWINHDALGCFCPWQ